MNPRLRTAPMPRTDYQSYIVAQEGRKELDNPLQGNLDRVCRALPPQPPLHYHVYSHITGTWLYKVLNELDKAAELVAETYPAETAWVESLQQPRVCFSHAHI